MHGEGKLLERRGAIDVALDRLVRAPGKRLLEERDLDRAVVDVVERRLVRDAFEAFQHDLTRNEREKEFGMYLLRRKL